MYKDKAHGFVKVIHAVDPSHGGTHHLKLGIWSDSLHRRKACKRKSAPVFARCCRAFRPAVGPEHLCQDETCVDGVHQSNGGSVALCIPRWLLVAARPQALMLFLGDRGQVRPPVLQVHASGVVWHHQPRVQHELSYSIEHILRANRGPHPSRQNTHCSWRSVRSECPP